MALEISKLMKVLYDFLMQGSKENDKKVADLWVQTGKQDHWDPCFSRPLNDWEVGKVEDLFSRLQGKVVDSAKEDKMGLGRKLRVKSPWQCASLARIEENARTFMD
ncbi:hypothetical protein CK203_112254 [Vitis vinifera]|uniref:Uncharacterized protein n=1 Tax=Vitis vinifera TaxID=29760 RepID=A0A438CNS0_VITVI|nr:hypothetical protein CK203_112254 [Vitis vinifera]